MSLFSGAGIGDIGLRAAGISFDTMVEIDPARAELCARNFPESRVLARDIRELGASPEEAAALFHSGGASPFLLTCTAPCQGMSKSGQGKLLSLIRRGERPKLDPRNRLVLPALRVICQLRPLWVIFENVLEMRTTMIEDEQGQVRQILDIIHDTLAPLGYDGEAYDIECADYGVPQRRQRLITVYTRDDAARRAFTNGARLVPPTTHAARGAGGRDRWVSVTEALRDFPPLDAKSPSTARDDRIPLHRVPVLDPKKYEWIRHTPEGASAFDNQCVNPTCGYTGNPTHGNHRGKDGINRALKTTPLYCERCGSLLPRPYTEVEGGKKRIMSGYTSAYKRMSPHLPAPTLTRNLSYPCSDHKVHPREHRVLSLAEAITIHTLDRYHYQWGDAPDSLIRLVLGESVPPAFMEKLGAHLLAMGHSVADGRRIPVGSQAHFWK